ncbi:MAG: signal recognition particle-docking protein FtsY [Alphaproteobacteria bacterium]|nr:signal recognition particle-docking protein FtsY [Alphaproteobacteria bacterium]
MPPSNTEKKVGWLGRLTAGLRKSSAKLVGGIGDLVTKRKLDDAALEDLEELLITADLGAATAARLTANLAKTRFGKDVTEDEVRTAFADDIAQSLEPVALPLDIDATKKPFVILVVGVNGAGKTTTIGKLTKQFRDDGRRVTLTAGDTFRAAAVEQLQVWGQRTGAPVIARETGSDAAGLAFDALNEASARADDVLLIDTAGRLQNKDNLMAELAKIVRVIKKKDETAPHAVLLVLDATVGQNAHSQVEAFQDVAGVTGLVLTKVDGTAKGGVVVALAEKFGLPVHYLGVGEGVDDLRPFTATDFARGLLGFS